jgi:hypothetical protein
MKLRHQDYEHLGNVVVFEVLSYVFNLGLMALPVLSSHDKVQYEILHSYTMSFSGTVTVL